jgi:hypothetical protein
MGNLCFYAYEDTVENKVVLTNDVPNIEVVKNQVVENQETQIEFVENEMGLALSFVLSNILKFDDQMIKFYKPSIKKYYQYYEKYHIADNNTNTENKNNLIVGQRYTIINGVLNETYRGTFIKFYGDCIFLDNYYIIINGTFVKRVGEIIILFDFVSKITQYNIGPNCDTVDIINSYL